jgi:hypothetical protein
VPILTLPQARRLVVGALSRRYLPKADAIALVRYYLRRNAIAYRSHTRKRPGCHGGLFVS